MHKETQPIDRETLLLEANKIIREHEDTMAGIVATGVTQKKWRAGFQRRLLFRRARVTDPLKAPRCLTCLNTWRMCCLRSITWLINPCRMALNAIRQSLFTSTAFVHAATSAAATDPRFPPRCR